MLFALFLGSVLASILDGSVKDHKADSDAVFKNLDAQIASFRAKMNDFQKASLLQTKDVDDDDSDNDVSTAEAGQIEDRSKRAERVEKIIADTKVATPNSWVEADGFPTSNVEKRAFADLDKTSEQFMQLKKAFMNEKATAHKEIQASIEKSEKALAAEKKQEAALPSSFIQEGDAPSSWEEADGFPANTKAFSDLDAAQAQFMKLKKAWIHDRDNTRSDLSDRIKTDRAKVEAQKAAIQSSFLQTDDDDVDDLSMHTRGHKVADAIAASTVSTPSSWMEALGFPSDKGEAEAYTDLDKSVDGYSDFKNKFETKMAADRAQMEKSIQRSRAELVHTTASSFAQISDEPEHQVPELVPDLQKKFDARVAEVEQEKKEIDEDNKAAGYPAVDAAAAPSSLIQTANGMYTNSFDAAQQKVTALIAKLHHTASQAKAKASSFLETPSATKQEKIDEAKDEAPITAAKANMDSLLKEAEGFRKHADAQAHKLDPNVVEDMHNFKEGSAQDEKNKVFQEMQVTDAAEKEMPEESSLLEVRGDGKTELADVENKLHKFESRMKREEKSFSHDALASVFLQEKEEPMNPETDPKFAPERSAFQALQRKMKQQTADFVGHIHTLEKDEQKDMVGTVPKSSFVQTKVNNNWDLEDNMQMKDDNAEQAYENMEDATEDIDEAPPAQASYQIVGVPQMDAVTIGSTIGGSATVDDPYTIPKWNDVPSAELDAFATPGGEPWTNRGQSVKATNPWSTSMSNELDSDFLPTSLAQVEQLRKH